MGLWSYSKLAWKKNKFFENLLSTFNSMKIFYWSVITDPDSEVIVLNWIPNKVISAELIIDTYRDGDSFDSFKNRCEGKSPTLVLIKTTQDIIFGVFTTVP